MLFLRELGVLTPMTRKERKKEKHFAPGAFRARCISRPILTANILSL